MTEAWLTGPLAGIDALLMPPAHSFLADVLAYFLKLNDYPVGQEELKPTTDALKAIRFDKKAK